MISTNWVQGLENLEDVMYVRNKVFFEELNIDKDLIKDVYDQFSFNVVVYENSDIVGTGRLIFKDGQYQIGRIAVLKEYRGKHYGDLIVRMLIRKAINIGAKEVYLHSLFDEKGFYETIGFKVVKEPFFEAGHKHVLMVREGDVGGGCCC